ncbi:hypothetical protein [Sphingomonas sp. BK235]|uniref:hypothetical protein n=1 Tax=Sphingomonas sp. BK235 TaxID=2512131 RepID=UPI001049025E|nr:hypothetical protein [Sphingomonas sp. BK235]TCP30722.1 hypothetical protein EV292_11279 [Sphingomonas sp. BK235]
MTAVDLDTIRSDINVLRGELVAHGGMLFEREVSDLRGAVHALAMPGSAVREFPIGRVPRGVRQIRASLVEVRERYEQVLLSGTWRHGARDGLVDLNRAIAALTITLARATEKAAA